MSHPLHQIIEGCKLGQPLMQKNLYEYFYQDMMKLCLRYTKDIDKAATVYNDAMLKIFKALPVYKEEGNATAWIKRIMINTAIDFIRVKSNFQKEVVSSEEGAGDHPIENTVFEKMDAGAIRQLIYSLPEKPAVVFNLFVYEEYDHNEISTVLGIPAGTSRYYLSEARRLLKDKLVNPHFSLNKNALS